MNLNLIGKVRKKSTLFKRRCFKCNKRKKVAYSEDTLMDIEFRMLFYCQSCGSKRIKHLEEKSENAKREASEEKKKQAEIDRLSYLKREIERIEIEQKAKELGINYPHD